MSKKENLGGGDDDIVLEPDFEGGGDIVLEPDFRDGSGPVSITPYSTPVTVPPPEDAPVDEAPWRNARVTMDAETTQVAMPRGVPVLPPQEVADRDREQYLARTQKHERVFSLPDREWDGKPTNVPDEKWQKVVRDYAKAGGNVEDRGYLGSALAKRALLHQANSIADRIRQFNYRIADEQAREQANFDRITELDAQLLPLAEALKGGKRLPPEEINIYLGLAQEREALAKRYDERMAPFAAEDKELKAAREYVSKQLQENAIIAAQDPKRKQRDIIQREADRDFAEAAALLDKYKAAALLHPQVVAEYVQKPAYKELLRFGGNVGAFALRLGAADLRSKSGDQRTGASEMLTQAADWFSDGLRNLEASKPQVTKTPLLGEDWSLNEGWLPKFVQGGTYMGLLAAGGHTGGVAGMTGMSMVGSGEDYYIMGKDSGMRDQEAEAFSLLMSGTEAFVENVNRGPFIASAARKELARRAAKAIMAGKPMRSALQEIPKYLLEQSGGEGFEEIVTSIGQHGIQLGADALTGSELNPELNATGLASDFLMGAALGGLMAVSGTAMNRPLYKESVRWAVENREAFTEWAQTNVPEEKLPEVLERLDRYSKIYRGLPPDLSPDKAANIAAAIAEKQKIKEQQKEQVLDPVVAEVAGDPLGDRLAELDEEIKQNLTPVAPDIAPLEQDRQKALSELKPDGLTHRDRKRIIAQASLEDVPLREAHKRAGYKEVGGIMVSPDVDASLLGAVHPDVWQAMVDRGISYIENSGTKGHGGALSRMHGGELSFGLDLSTELSEYVHEKEKDFPGITATRVNHVIAHEIGHKVWQNDLTDEQRAVAEKAAKGSLYARNLESGALKSAASIAEENFCENFAWGLTQRLTGQSEDSVQPDLKSLIEGLVTVTNKEDDTPRRPKPADSADKQPAVGSEGQGAVGEGGNRTADEARGDSDGGRTSDDIGTVRPVQAAPKTDQVKEEGVGTKAQQEESAGAVPNDRITPRPDAVEELGDDRTDVSYSGVKNQIAHHQGNARDLYDASQKAKDPAKAKKLLDESQAEERLALATMDEFANIATKEDVERLRNDIRKGWTTVGAAGRAFEITSSVPEVVPVSTTVNTPEANPTTPSFTLEPGGQKGEFHAKSGEWEVTVYPHDNGKKFGWTLFKNGKGLVGQDGHSSPSAARKAAEKEAAERISKEPKVKVKKAAIIPTRGGVVAVPINEEEEPIKRAKVGDRFKSGTSEVEITAAAPALDGTPTVEYAFVNEDGSLGKKTRKSAAEFARLFHKHVEFRQPEPKPAKHPFANLSEEKRKRALELEEKLKKLSGRLTSGLDPERFMLGAEYTALVLEDGARGFAEYARVMVDRLGDWIKPHLKSLYSAARYAPGTDPATLSPDSEVAAADVDAILNETPPEDGTGNLETPSEATLEGVPSKDVQKPGAIRDAGGGTAEGSRPDVQGSGRTGANGNEPPRGVGGSKVEVPVPAGGEVTLPADGVTAQDQGSNYTAPQGDAVYGGDKSKYKNNVAAIRLLKLIESEKRGATKEEQSVLAKYVGWGGLPGAFKRSDGSATKGWEKESDELKALLTPEEYRAAAASTRNAHYTSAEIIRGMWDAVRRLGFAGGKVLEPSVGIGNFFANMPNDFRDHVSLHGVELDNITGGIAKLLFPHANIKSPLGFQDYSIPDGYFDLAIMNPPFGAEILYDKNRKDLSKFSIHNYFIAKSIDTLKPGGLMAVVVTNRMMDSHRDHAREYVNERAELVGAIRLPNNAFSKNAGTEVTTDILFFRKPEVGQKPNGESWLAVKDYKDKNGNVVPLNEYFIKHPEMMLGEFGQYGTMYRPGDSALVAREGQDTGALLQAAIATLPESVAKPVQHDPVPDKPMVRPMDVKDVPVGSFFVHDGVVLVRQPDAMGEAMASDAVFSNQKESARVEGMVGIRDAMIELRNLQLREDATDSALKASREKLNKKYDTFVKDFGYINSSTNKRLFRDDPTWPQISALENNYNKGVSDAVSKRTGSPVTPPSADKAAIFTKRTQSPYKSPATASSAENALVISLSEKGRVDLPYMSSLYGRSESEIVQELGNLLYRDPKSTWVTRDEYLSGNVKAKLADAIEAAKDDPAYDRNVEDLKAVQPEDIPAVDISLKAGASWLPQKVMTDFGRMISESKYGKASYSPATATWSFEDLRATEVAEQKYGTGRIDVRKVLNAVANQRAITVTDEVDGKRIVNEKETSLANERVKEVRKEFDRWIWEDDSRRESLSRLYNDMFNTTIERLYDGAHLTLPGKVGDDIITLRPHQMNAVWRIIQSATVLLDHIVGSGKTFTMVAAAMELRRLGLAQKPMLVVPNHLVSQWAQDFSKLYPGAKVLATTKEDFNKENRKRLFARITTGDWDVVIVAHSAFGRVKVSPEQEAEFIEEQILDLITSLQAVEAAEGRKSRNVKDIEKKIESLRQKLKKRLDAGSKDEGLYWDQLGIDALLVDEFHEFKNLAYSTSMSRIAGLGNQKGSNKASDMYLKSRQVMKATGGRNFIVATGTPISNTMAEEYTMQRYLDYDALKAQGLSHFDAWARQFGEVITDWGLSPAGKYKLYSRFAKFVNMPELIQRYQSFADVINQKDIEEQLAKKGEVFPVPKVRGGRPQNVVVERSKNQARFIHSLIFRSENLPKKPEKGADNMLKVMSDARKAALDMRLIDPTMPDDPNSKVNVAAKNIKDIYDKWDQDKGTQLVFIDLSTPKASKGKEVERIKKLLADAESQDEQVADAAQEALDKMSPDELMALDSDFSVYDDLRQKLLNLGIRQHEIAFIHDANTDQQKLDLFERVKSGSVRVLLGSTAKMGAGMNVQDRLVALHHLDAPWRPMDLEQREGRIIRQGNLLYKRDPQGFEVDVLRYATKGTLDSRMWETLETKARFIEQFRKGDIKTRVIEDIGGEAANSAEMKAAASGNPLILEEMTLRRKLRDLENEQYGHTKTQHRVRDAIRMANHSIKYYSEHLAIREADVKLEVPEKFEMTVKGTKYDKREEAGAAILTLAKDGKTGKVGQYGQFDIVLGKDDIGRYYAKAVGTGTYSSEPFDPTKADAQGLSQRITNAVDRIGPDINVYKRYIAEAEADIPRLNAQLVEWEKADELAKAAQEHQKVIEQLKKKKKDSADVKKKDEDPDEPGGGGDLAMRAKGSKGKMFDPGQRKPTAPQRVPTSRVKFNITALVQMLTDLDSSVSVNQRLRRALGKYKLKENRVELMARLLWDTELAERVLAHEVGHMIDLAIEAKGKGLSFARKIKPLDAFKKRLKDSAELKKLAKELSAEWRGEFSADDKYRNSANELFADFMSAMFNDPQLVKDKYTKLHDTFQELLDGKPDFAAAYKVLTDRILGKGVAAEWIRKTMDASERSVQELTDHTRNSLGWHWARFKDAMAGLFVSPVHRLNEIQGKKLSRDLGESMIDTLEYASLFTAKENAFFEDDFRRHVAPLMERISKDNAEAFKLLDVYVQANRTIHERRAAGKWIEANHDDEARKMLLSLLDQEKSLEKWVPLITNAKNSELYDLAGQIFREVHQMGEAAVARMGRRIDRMDLEITGQAALMAFNVRGKLLNPHGITVSEAKAAVDELRSMVTPEQFDAIEQAQRRLSELLFEIQFKAFNEGLISHRAYQEIIAPNMDNYAPYVVLDHFSGRVTAGIAPQAGTAKAVMNTVLATQLKAAAINSWRQHQYFTAMLILAYEKSGKTVKIEKDLAKASDIDKIRMDHRDDDVSRLVYYKDGTPYVAEFEGDPGKTFEEASVTPTRWESLESLGPLSSITAGALQLFTGWSLPFIVWGNLVRDLSTSADRIGWLATFQSLGKGGISEWNKIRLARNYAKAAFGSVMENEIRELIAKDILQPPRTAGAMVFDNDNRRELLAAGTIMAYGLTKHQLGSKAWNKFKQYGGLNSMTRASVMYEALAKLHALDVARAAGQTPKVAAALARRAGVPKPAISGSVKWVNAMMEMLRPWTRVSIQGNRAAYNVLMNPSTGKKFAARFATAQLGWKVTAASIKWGVPLMFYYWLINAGDDEEEKAKRKGRLAVMGEAFKRVSPYKMAIGNIIPMMFYDPRKGEYHHFWEFWEQDVSTIPAYYEVVSLRVPASEEGKTFGPLFYNMMVSQDEELRMPGMDVGDAFRSWVHNQTLPGANPFIEIGGNTFSMVTGENPDDEFTGYPAANPLLYDAGWGDGRGEAITGYILNKSGWLPQVVGTMAANFGMLDERAMNIFTRRLAEDKVPLAERIPGAGAMLSYDNYSATRERGEKREEHESVEAQARMMIPPEYKEMLDFYHKNNGRKKEMDAYELVRLTAAHGFERTWGDVLNPPSKFGGGGDTLNVPRARGLASGEIRIDAPTLHARAVWAVANDASAMTRDSITQDIEELGSQWLGLFQDPQQFIDNLRATDQE